MSPLASAAASSGGGDGFSMLLLLLPLALIAFLFISQRNRQKKFKEMQADLAVGSRVMTTTGLYGTIAAMDETTVQIEAAPGVVLQFDRRVVMQAPGAQPPHAQPGPDDTQGDN
ncbi:preprotein translocase subunit YajC [Ornithinimicrobium cavernae]|uniref:preprotein translocase subunit YajC n=1 Tax=Ornithinimicrobium cavernae TaxID=2666047 RepID=UPI000D69EFA0|nr:preprotein translocase subunit YajC [Ornithinimicrobium cavernae]